MRTFALIAIIIALGIFLLLRQRSSQMTQREFKSTDELVQYSAAEAVADAAKQDHVELDYSVDSIEKVDGILGKLHDLYVKDQSSVLVAPLARAYGAYIGEAIRRSEPGTKWARDHRVMGEKSYPLNWRGGESFPMAWCYRRIVNGPEDDVWIKYLAIKQGRTKQLREQIQLPE
jgi:hypothetical protein